MTIITTTVRHRAPTCLHSAATDPTAPADAPLRRSIQVRRMCAFKH